MSWHYYELSHSLGCHKADWDQLNAAVCDSNPFFDGAFIDNLLRYFGEGTERLCVHDTDGSIDGMLIVKPELLGKWSLFLPSQEQIGAVLVKDPDLLSDLVAALPGIARSLLCPCQDPYYNPFATLADKLPLVTVEHGLTIAISIEGEFENYWNGRPRKLRQNIGRYYRRAQEAGFNISLTRLDQVDEMEGAIQRYGMLESLGWKGQEGTAVHSENVQGKFYRDVLIDFAQRGKASVYELRFGDKVVAMRLCVATDNMLVMLKTAYDEAYAEYATGRLLLHALLVQAFKERRFKTIEFYTHANIDQIAWATDERMIMHVKLFRNPATKMAYSWMRRSLDVLRSLRDKLHIEAQSKSPLIVTALCIGSDNGCSSSD